MCVFSLLVHDPFWMWCPFGGFPFCCWVRMQPEAKGSCVCTCLLASDHFLVWFHCKMDCSSEGFLLLGAFAVGGKWLKRVCSFVGSATCRVPCSSWVRMQPQATRPCVCICLPVADQFC